jgi:hypothetical protein
VGILLSNVQAMEFEAQRRRRGRLRTVAAWRPLLLVVVLAVMLALAMGVGIEASQPEARPVATLIGHTAQMVAQAAETQIARRSRTPGPGEPGSDQLRHTGAGQLLALIVVAGGLVLLVRSRVR